MNAIMSIDVWIFSCCLDANNLWIVILFTDNKEAEPHNFSSFWKDKLLYQC